MSIFQKAYQWFLNWWGVFWLLWLWVYFNTESFVEMGQKWWMLLSLIMIISPLAAVFPKVKLFTNIKWLRKPLGIIAGCFMMAHGIGYFLHYKGLVDPISTLADAEFWSLSNGLMWGFFGSIIAFLLLVTSNAFSVKLLKDNWKYLHMLWHFLFIFVILHIILITWEFGVTMFFVIYLILHILVFFKVSWK